jgi:hypothetical protein
MAWMGLYAAMSVVAAVAIFLLAEWNRDSRVPAPDGPGRYALLGGALWPVLLVGAAQWGLIVAVQSRLRRSAVATGPGAPQPAFR